MNVFLPVAARASLSAASTASAPVHEKRHIESGPARSGELEREIGRVDGRADVDEVRHVVGEELAHALAEPRVVVAEVIGAEPGEKIEILAPFVIPEPAAARADEDAAIAERAEQLDERRIDVLGVPRDRGMRRGEGGIGRDCSPERGGDGSGIGGATTGWSAEAVGVDIASA